MYFSNFCFRRVFFALPLRPVFQGICAVIDFWPAPKLARRMRVQLIGQKIIVYASVASVLRRWQRIAYSEKCWPEEM
jgi:hypothetical protein